MLQLFFFCFFVFRTEAFHFSLLSDFLSSCVAKSLKVFVLQVRTREELKVVTERSRAYDQCDAYHVLHFLEIDDLSIRLAFCVSLLARNITLRVVIFLLKVQKSNLPKPFALLFR